MQTVHLRVAAVALAIAGLAAAAIAAPASAQGAPSSLAYGLYGALSSQGTGTATARVGMASGKGGLAFSHYSSVPLFSEALGIVSKGAVIGEMAFVTSGILAHTSGTGTKGATVQIESDASVASVSIELSLLPTTANPTPAPLLTLTAINVASQVMDTQTLPAVSTPVGTASFGGLSLSGSLVGGKTLTFSGAAPANTVLYDDAFMTVTLNQQIVTGTIVCAPTCQFVPKAMTANAIAVQMHKELIAGKPAASTIYVGSNEASIP
jgi:hypothetical protein